MDHCVGYLWVDETVVEPVDAATPWTTDMTSSLVDGVNTYGGDQWLAISLSDKYNFPAAITPSVMADQWQQMIRDGEVVLHCEYRLKENLREAVSHQLTDIECSMMDIVKDNISGIDTSTTFLATFAEILLKFKQEGMSSVCRIHGEQNQETGPSGGAAEKHDENSEDVSDKDDNEAPQTLDQVDGQPTRMSYRRKLRTPKRRSSSIFTSSTGRTKWTEERIRALINGVNTHGVGKWKQIKMESESLENVGTVAMKDKFRNLKLYGHVENVSGEWKLV